MLLYVVISRIETRADVAILDDVCRSIERQTKPVSLVVVVLCTHPDLPKAVVKIACRAIPSTFRTIKTPCDQSVLSPIAMSLVALHSLDNAFALANMWVVPIRNLRLAPKHHETLSREIDIEEEKEGPSWSLPRSQAPPPARPGRVSRARSRGPPPLPR